jgi:transketolase
VRKAFSRALFRAAEKDSRIVFVTADLGFQVFDEFRQRFGKRFINVGIAEAQLIYTAAGLAAEGWRPVAYSIASFATARPFEQIRYCISYPNLPVVLVGAGRGFLYSNSGVSHHAADDMALMSILPNMRVVTPGDPDELEMLFPQLFNEPRPAYLTVGRFGEPSYDCSLPAVLGKARVLREGKKLAIVTTGEMANEVLQAHAFLDDMGIKPAILQMHTVKPLDTATLDSLSSNLTSMVVVEEHVPLGGLWSAILDWYVTSRQTFAVKRLGPPDAFALGNLSQKSLRHRCQYDAISIAKTCKALHE